MAKNTSPKKDQSNSFEQGLLDLRVELSTRDITAGNEFAIFVLVKNPFSGPIWVREVNVSLPSELRIIEDENIKILEAKETEDLENIRKENEKIEEKINILISDVEKLLVNEQIKNNDDMKFAVENLRQKIRDFEDKVEARGGEVSLTVQEGTSIGHLNIVSKTASVTIQSDKDAKTQIDKVEIFDPILYKQQTGQARTIRLKSSLPEEAALQPGSTAVYTVVLNVKKSLVFTPSKYRLLFYVNYGFESLDRNNFENGNKIPDNIFASTVAHEIAIRPSVYSVIVGAVLGGVSGSVVKILQNTSTISIQSAGISIALATILSAIAVVFMVRKSDAQSFVSVEDFWGGILIGFLVGYSGITFFEGLAGITGS